MKKTYKIMIVTAAIFGFAIMTGLAGAYFLAEEKGAVDDSYEYIEPLELITPTPTYQEQAYENSYNSASVPHAQQEAVGGSSGQVNYDYDQSPVSRDCSQTAEGCNTVNWAPIAQAPDLTPLNIQSNPVVLPPVSNHDQAIKYFNDSTTIQPKPSPCVPVGDGFNCL